MKLLRAKVFLRADDVIETGRLNSSHCGIFLSAKLCLIVTTRLSGGFQVSWNKVFPPEWRSKRWRAGFLSILHPVKKDNRSKVNNPLQFKYFISLYPHRPVFFLFPSRWNIPLSKPVSPVGSLNIQLQPRQEQEQKGIGFIHISCFLFYGRPFAVVRASGPVSADWSLTPQHPQFNYWCDYGQLAILKV